MRIGAIVLVSLAACGGGGGGSIDGGDGDGDGGAADAATGCPRSPAAADRDRAVVVSHPYAAGGGNSNAWELLTLSSSGSLSSTGTTFTMGRATSGEVAFTPDGEVGLVAQEDGTLGVFTVSGDSVTVIDAGFDAGGADGFYATGVVMASDGAHAWVLNGQWRENGGGIYRVAIDCAGALTYEKQIAAARLPYAMVLGPDADQALIVAEDILDSTGNDVHLLSWDAPPAVLGGADAFADDEQIVSAAEVTADRTHLLVADNNSFSATGNRIAVLAISGQTFTAGPTLTDVDDPFDLVASPFDDAILVVSGFGDSLHILDYDTAISYRGELTYDGPAPELPGNAVMVSRGTNTGLVLLAENTGIRRVQFAGSGTVTDLGLTTTGTGLAGIPGAIGAQP